MQRRDFLKTTSLALVGTSMPSSPLGASTPGVTTGTFTPGTEKLADMPKDFTGISIEAPQLYNPHYYTAANKSLVAAFRGMSANGVFRSGGHLGDVARWNGPNGDFSDPRQDAGVARGKEYWEWKLTDPSVRDTKNGAITPASIRNLRAFLDATNWRLIYGLNFWSGSPARAADEAAFVSKVMGDRLLAFQIGNEDDQLSGKSPFRAPGYDFEQYYREYQDFVGAIRKAVPAAKFGGPDTSNMGGLLPFAAKPDNEAAFLSSHFYAMGPAKDPAMNAARLLGPNERLARQFVQAKQATAASGGLPYRMTEGNSCFGGGKPDVSNAYASTLWGADYMLQCAAAGYAGVNLHGGGDGYYTSIAVGPDLSTELRPLYYGMQFADHFAGSTLLNCSLATTANVSAFHGRRGTEKHGETLVAFINKSSDPITVSIAGIAGSHPPSAELRLTGPSLEAKTGVALTTHKPASTSASSVPGYSAVLLKWQ